MNKHVTRWPVTPVYLLGLAAVAAARLLTLPESLWEWDEFLFVKGVEHFNPLGHQPHPPGYPLLIGLGKLLNLFFRDAFTSLVALSVISSVIGYAALADAFRRLAQSGLETASAERIGVAGALLFHLCPTMLVYGPLALSDAPALMFLSLALAAATRISDQSLPWAAAFGVFASGAIGCRPQLALSVLPVVAVVLALARGNRRLATASVALAAFTAMSLIWFVPLVVAVGGLDGLASFLGKQAQLFATYDAKVPRAELSPSFIAFRFIAHPWGQRWTSLPVLALAAAGIAWLALRRPRPIVLLAPLAVLCGIELALCLLAMNPADGVRYALPSVLGVAFAAAVGCQVLARRLRLPAAGFYAPVALLCAGFVVYASPLLADRSTTPSPPVQAAEWVKRSLPPTAVLLVEKELAAHASYLLPDFQRGPMQEGLQQFALEIDTPVYLIGDGESGWPDTHRFEWPASDAYGKLTRNLYRVVTVSPVPPERRYKALRGIHNYEPSPREAKWRWLDQEAAIRLRRCETEARALALTFRLPPQARIPSATLTASVLTAAVQGAAPATVIIHRGEERRVVLPLPAAPAVDVAIRSDASFVPAQAGDSNDSRRLSVQLLSVEQLAR